MNESLYTRRNIPECMGTAWTLMSTNIARTARTMWLPAVILAVLCAATALLNIYQSGQIAGGNINCALAICVVAGLVLLVAASLFLDAKIFKLLSLQSLRYCWARTSASFGVNVAITVAVVLVVWGIASSDVMLASSGRMTATAALLLFAGEMLIAAVLLLAFLSPVVYVLTKYIIEPETTMRSAWRAYRTGLRSAGFIVAFVLLCAVVLLIAYVVIALPMMIATGALALSEAGSAAGDAPGLPGSFPVLYALTAFVMCFVWVVLRVWSIFATYYMYASIEAKNGRTDNADGFGGGE